MALTPEWRHMTERYDFDEHNWGLEEVPADDLGVPLINLGCIASPLAAAERFSRRVLPRAARDVQTKPQALQR
jgi:hypothetical protein